MADHPNVPLVVDLDGTLIRTDMMWESLARLLRRNPLAIFQVLFWWMRGRAWLKQELAERVQVDPATLPYHERFRDWLRQEKAAGRKIVLATASDLQMAEPVAACTGLFDSVLASDGLVNLRQENKRLALVREFGERGFDYAGNSQDDLTVWRSARQAIVVNAPPWLRQQAGTITELGPSFCDGYSRSAVARSFATELFWRSGYLVAMTAGLLLALAFPKWSLAGFAWIAPALLLVAAHGQRGWDSFRTGCVGGLTFWLVSLYWLLLMPATGLPILGWLALAGYVSLYFGAWVWLTARLSPSHPHPHPHAAMRQSNPSTSETTWENGSWTGRTLWALSGAAIWVAMEMIRARLFSGFPWSFLGVSQYQLIPLIQMAAFTGVYGVSFLITWFSLSLYSAGLLIWRQPAKRQVWQVEIVLPLFAVVGCYVGGFFALSPVPAKNSLRVTAIQPSVPQTLIWNSDDNARRFASLLALSQHALTNPASDLLVWPESAVPDLDRPTFEAINQFVQSNHVWLILNSDDVEARATGTNYFNAAFLIGPDGRWRQAYHKRQLVIFGEYVPLANWLPFLKWLTPIEGGWTAGAQPETFAIQRRPLPGDHVIQITADPTADPASATVNCAPLICFEDTFAGATRASAQDDVDFLVNLTNDGWFQESAEQRQHLANAVFRTVENDLPLLRCANNGVTCFINRHGRIETVFCDPQHSEYGPGALTLDIPLPDQKPAPTFYHRHGDWFGWSCVALAGLLLIRSSTRTVAAAEPADRKQP